MHKRETVVVIVLVSYCGVSAFVSNSLFNNILSDLDSGGFVK